MAVICLSSCWDAWPPLLAAEFPVTVRRGMNTQQLQAANLVFSAEGGRCAAYDFQYTGWGVGMVDVAYLLCSSGDEQQVAAHEEALLRHYHTTLMSRLGELQPGLVAEAAQRTYTWEVLRQHYDLALLDFVRFMAGWGSWGAVGYAHNAARQAARRLGLLKDDPGRAR
ncbi:hypothetical protein QJQ45_002314 [Haematococcus lacustris]|nr:hypothetical protein QJQ45_002314 [Haematococcus lacustris]